MGEEERVCRWRPRVPPSPGWGAGTWKPAPRPLRPHSTPSPPPPPPPASLTLLLRGQVVYAGPNGPPAIDYIEVTSPASPPYAGGSGAFSNPAEWLVDVTTQADRDGRAGELAAAFAASPAAAEVEARVEAMITHAPQPSASVKAALATRSATTTPAWWGVLTLLRFRGAWDLRDGAFLGPRLGDKVFLTLCIVTLFWRLGAKPPVAVAAGIPSLLFLWTVLPGYSAAAYMPALVLERALYVRRVNRGMEFKEGGRKQSGGGAVTGHARPDLTPRTPPDLPFPGRETTACTGRPRTSRSSCWRRRRRWCR